MLKKLRRLLTQWLLDAGERTDLSDQTEKLYEAIWPKHYLYEKENKKIIFDALAKASQLERRYNDEIR